MQYFILMPGDTEADCVNETNLLGESSFEKFYSGSGLKVLMKIVNNRPELLPSITIKTDKGKTLSIEEFLTDIKSLKVL